ncbi:hypothetical protein C1645_839746 [Glomus cerebriforme]|uniref:Uncharacterized protein n=1 Tax=Glomus cerebriforme TaxID=658196 RepID=A0A397S051_9GLOM|nr:hypothetical protein C1645_839746 [Glomus cerebriforme]
MEEIKIEEKKVRKSNKIEKTIDEEGKRIIIEHMKEWEEQGKISKKPFADLAKKLKSKGYTFDSKAICDYWWNILDTRLDRETPFSTEEKNYIYEEASKYEKNNSDIKWTEMRNNITRIHNSVNARPSAALYAQVSAAASNSSPAAISSDKGSLQYILNVDENDGMIENVDENNEISIFFYSNDRK